MALSGPQWYASQIVAAVVVRSLLPAQLYSSLPTFDVLPLSHCCLCYFLSSHLILSASFLRICLSVLVRPWARRLCLAHSLSFICTSVFLSIPLDCTSEDQRFLTTNIVSHSKSKLVNSWTLSNTHHRTLGLRGPYQSRWISSRITSRAACRRRRLEGRDAIQ